MSKEITHKKAQELIVELSRRTKLKLSNKYERELNKYVLQQVKRTEKLVISKMLLVMLERLVNIEKERPVVKANYKSLKERLWKLKDE